MLSGPRTQRTTMLRFEAARHVQVDPETLEVGLWPLPPGNRSGSNVMIVAAKREVLSRWVGVLDAIGLELSEVDALPRALLRVAAHAGLPTAESDRPASESLWGALDIGFSGALVAVALGSQCVYVRAIALGGDSFTAAVRDALRVDYGTAERLKRQYRSPGQVEGSPAAGDQGESAQLQGVLHSVLQGRVRTLAGEVERAFAYAMESYPEKTPVGLYVCGGAAKLAGLPAGLRQRLGIEVKLLNPCCRVEVPAGGIPVQETHYPSLAACVGLALGGRHTSTATGVHGVATDAAASHGAAPVNLLPESARLVQAGRRRLRRWASALSVAMLVVAGVWFWSRDRSAELGHVQAALAEETVDIRHERKRAAGLAARAEVLRKRLEVFDTMRADESWAERLAELAQAVPEQVVLRRIEVMPTRNLAPLESRVSGESAGAAGPAGVEVQIEGLAPDHLVVATFLHRLQVCGAYEEVRLVRSAAAVEGGSGPLDFAIACRR
jgi:cell division ATPase FtsA